MARVTGPLNCLDDVSVSSPTVTQTTEELLLTVRTTRSVPLLSLTANSSGISPLVLCTEQFLPHLRCRFFPTRSTITPTGWLIGWMLANLPLWVHVASRLPHCMCMYCVRKHFRRIVMSASAHIQYPFNGCLYFSCGIGGHDHTMRSLLMLSPM